MFVLMIFACLSPSERSDALFSADLLISIVRRQHRRSEDPFSLNGSTLYMCIDALNGLFALCPSESPINVRFRLTCPSACEPGISFFFHNSTIVCDRLNGLFSLFV